MKKPRVERHLGLKVAGFAGSLVHGNAERNPRKYPGQAEIQFYNSERTHDLVCTTVWRDTKHENYEARSWVLLNLRRPTCKNIEVAMRNSGRSS